MKAAAKTSCRTKPEDALALILFAKSRVRPDLNTRRVGIAPRQVRRPRRHGSMYDAGLTRHPLRAEKAGASGVDDRRAAEQHGTGQGAYHLRAGPRSVESVDAIITRLDSEGRATASAGKLAAVQRRGVLPERRCVVSQDFTASSRRAAPLCDQLHSTQHARRSLRKSRRARRGRRGLSRGGTRADK